MLRFEVTEEPSPGCDGERICYLPGRGLFRSSVSANGDIVVADAYNCRIIWVRAHHVVRQLGTTARAGT